MLGKMVLCNYPALQPCPGTIEDWVAVTELSTVPIPGVYTKEYTRVSKL